jgi:hypothetical protein
MRVVPAASGSKGIRRRPRVLKNRNSATVAAQSNRLETLRARPEN